MSNFISTRRAQLWLALGLLALLAACSPEPADDHPGQPVAQRRKIFKEILNTLEPMGLMARDRKPFVAPEFLKQATQLKALSTQPWAHFGTDTNYAPSRARPEVWSKAAEFKQAQESFVRGVADLAEAAQSADLARIKPAVQLVQDQCLSCHRDFRTKGPL